MYHSIILDLKSEVDTKVEAEVEVEVDKDQVQIITMTGIGLSIICYYTLVKCSHTEGVVYYA